MMNTMLLLAQASDAASANSTEPGPHLMKTEVARPVTVAECELGIPPVPTRRSATKFLVRTVCRIAFMTWAMNHADTADIRMGL